MNGWIYFLSACVHRAGCETVLKALSPSVSFVPFGRGHFPKQQRFFAKRFERHKKNGVMPDVRLFVWTW